ncbi:MAG: DUF2000 domain-containing protein [Clostridium sp.]|nr:DUF2000 domain-containing protein [Clostridium sp.]
MKEQNTKCVVVINEDLPLGVIANTSTILGITLGKHIPEVVGEDVVDFSGKSHLGIITIPVPILKGTQEVLKKLREELYIDYYDDLIVVDFSDVAQSCNVYSEYIKKVTITAEEEHNYFGLAIYGNKKKVNKLTGSMPLLR